MEPFQTGLLLATLLCSLTAGFLLAFASVAMPGIGGLNDRDFLRAFQVIDGVIQKNQPVFMLMWVGSVVTLATAGVFGFQQLQGADRLILLGAVLSYLLGVQLPTLTINIPLNNQLQTLNVQTLTDSALADARRSFEPRWNRWNVLRTVLAVTTSALLILLVLRL